MNKVSKHAVDNIKKPSLSFYGNVSILLSTYAVETYCG
jgi:hypothetical protein